MLRKVTRPDQREVLFEYDALGRRTAKIFGQQVTRWVWNGGKPLHEWRYNVAERPVTVIDDTGNVHKAEEPVPPETLTTWVFEAESSLLLAKISGGKNYSVITDHIGTPCQAYDEEGNIVWSCELDIYGKVRKLAGPIDFIPFRYQGQYEDVETGLYYNRYRYYSPEEGIYISQDPIAPLAGLRFYSYVKDPNSWVDLLGLVAGPAGLPDSPGIYIITNGKESYVGSSGIGEQGMHTRVSDVDHLNAQRLLEMEGTKVQYVRVNLGTATDLSERNNILRYYEQREYDKQVKKRGMTMLNDPTKRIQAIDKKKVAEKLIQDHGVTASKRRVTVRCK
jgi:RHS repeat-associated protein